ncbi:hypothetical protein SAMN05421878_10561 [Actinobaculum suis]|uniref:Uncharacterized protein n=1 Tax=Actinobaculum suis TaxID=1657 RepID=A0A0K9ERM6_9ACTO|nr:hypothetical protein [Actinobaculum suis]KMY22859.1 hypothetical protein ACU19_07565 [Actinobaculum suis]MDY5153772.1 hypothetical protein [Actinobaculum suis]OCA93967.1 hypothetical protein ACU20_07150 [Actinobaculum suis]OCA94533.1 hypothetical protein ACU21_06535 [Actinobaculum suis]SDE28133.1 hypothetical protein SAMN05421878_10561 [Actinobaculum suis]
MARLRAEGEVTAITYPGAGPNPAVQVHVHTTAGVPVTLCFLGRRDIRCIQVGSRILFDAVHSANRPGLAYNPRYTVLEQPS